CYISARVEFVLLPMMLGLAVVAAAAIAAWQFVPGRWCGLGPGEDDTLSCTTSEAGSVYGEGHQHQHHHHHHRHVGEHMPLLIDNDPASKRPAGSRAHNASDRLYGPISMAQSAQSMPRDPDDSGESVSFEEQYGSWFQRSGRMIQNPSNGQ
ncbi:hypothetical protein GGI23_005530, partial [Coemansia sp. RSA 2559]